MSQSPLVSVLIPAYNQAPYIKDALDSLQRQTYANWEAAIVDDGSPDNVAEVVREYVASDPRIKFYHTENHGLSAARNYAASKTSGDFLLPLDADDTIEPEYIEQCVKKFSENPALKVVYCDWSWFGNETKAPPIPYRGYEKLLIANTIFCSGMFRRSDYERVGGYDTEIPYGYEDWDFWLSLLDEKAEVYQIPQRLFNYRTKATSMRTVVNQQNNQRVTREYLYRKHLADYLRIYPDMIDILQRLQYRDYRYDKWKRRSLPSRLWHALKGTF